MELPTDTVTAEYPSPLGKIILASSGGILRGLWFSDQRYACAGLTSNLKVSVSHEFFQEIGLWLDGYFNKENSTPSFAFQPFGTVFQRKVWEELLNIPYGQTAAYKQIAEKLGCQSARAVGSAIGRNPISIIIPCHRVIGSDGSLTGYAGGIERKRKLLLLEGSVKNE